MRGPSNQQELGDRPSKKVRGRPPDQQEGVRGGRGGRGWDSLQQPKEKGKGGGGGGTQPRKRGDHPTKKGEGHTPTNKAKVEKH